MAYKGNKTYLSTREREIRKCLKERNVEGLLWVILNDCFEDMEQNKTPRYGKTMLTFVIQQLAIIEGKKTYKGSSASRIEEPSGMTKNIIEKWLATREDLDG